MTKPKLLFISPNYYGFNEVVLEGFINYSGCEVQHIVSNEKYIYENFGEKAGNFFAKIFLGKNLKSEKAVKKLTSTINALEQFDYIVINRHDLLTKDQMLILKSKTKNLLSLLWDSLEKIPQLENNIDLFNKVYSFDGVDAEQHGFVKINNFYFIKKAVNNLNTFKVSYLGTYDKRIKQVIKFFTFFKEQEISSKAKIYIYHSELYKVKEVLPATVQFIHDIIPFSEAYKFYEDSKIILDLAHENQRGLSFRPYEAIGLKKKLITNNSEIMKYDFYDPQNIFVVDTGKEINIPVEFFESDYKEVEQSIADKYYIKNWVAKIIQDNE
ncbi:lipopolysaccharide core biosynthesis protein rfaS [Kaistella carnis]|uniref:lipopolysaccharide core biosynthesis protein rfaS n=2 Tax=Kaistella carnis TaxID=1241979 RepID=UPI0028B020FE|nr:lipopolysaccharide core biosynthesis protein rfaS [Kaistella carnis]